MRRILIASVGAAVAAYIWGFLFWNVFPLQNLVLESVGDQPALVDTLFSDLGGAGYYLVGSADGGGQLATVFLNEGRMSFGTMLLMGFLHMLITMAITAWFVSMIPQLPPVYAARVTVVASIGLIVAVGANLGDPVWWNQPWGWNVLQAVYDLTLWTAGGFVIAAVIKPDAEQG